jgi:hypothetical protein
MCGCDRETKEVCDRCAQGVRDLLRWGYAETIARRAYGWKADVILGCSPALTD